MIDLFHQLREAKFLFVVNTFHAFGGAERQALILATYIKAHISDRVAFLAFQDGESFRQMIEKAGITTYCFPFQHHAPRYKKMIQYWQLIKFIRPIQADSLIPYVAESNKIVAQIWPYVGAKYAFWNQREEGRKLYGTAHEKKLINAVPAIVSNSFEGRDALIRVYGLEKEQITVINNGIIPPTNVETRKDWHTHFEIPEERPLISMIANITDRKDHKTLLEAWSMVIRACKTKEMPLPFLVLVGRKDRTYNDLRLLGFDLKLSDHIGFTGALSTRGVQDIIEQSHFCVFSSNLEGCPNGVLECMAQGKAVVGTHISGVEQALGTTYADTCLSQPNNPQDLANKILQLYEQPELIQKIGVQNLKRIEKEFSVDQMVKKHLALILFRDANH